jgi:hypothetical protein
MTCNTFWSAHRPPDKLKIQLWHFDRACNIDLRVHFSTTQGAILPKELMPPKNLATSLHWHWNITFSSTWNHQISYCKAKSQRGLSQRFKYSSGKSRSSTLTWVIKSMLRLRRSHKDIFKNKKQDSKSTSWYLISLKFVVSRSRPTPRSRGLERIGDFRVIRIVNLMKPWVCPKP